MRDLTDRLIEGSLRAANDAATCAENAPNEILEAFYRAKSTEHKRWAAAYAEATPLLALMSDTPGAITRRTIRAQTLAATKAMPFLRVSGEEAIVMAQRAFQVIA
jgi:hypothetical protein